MLQELKSQHREIARLKFEGQRPAEIASITGMALSSIHGILSDPLCKAHMARLSDDADNSVVNVRRKLAKMNTKAVDVIDEILTHSEGTSSAVRLKAAQDVLNRNGFAPVLESRHMSVHITSDDLNEMKQRAALASGAIIPGDG
jgi:hypothetical protein